jgi:hypothetical protein
MQYRAVQLKQKLTKTKKNYGSKFNYSKWHRSHYA